MRVGGPKRVGLVGLWLAALALRALFAHGVDVRETLRADGASYSMLAWNLVHHGVYSDALVPPFVPQMRWPPGYPLLLAPFYVGESPFDGARRARVAQVLLGSLLPVLTVVLGGGLVPPVAAWGAGIFAAFCPVLAATPAFLVSETDFAVLLAVALLVLGRLVEAPSRGRALAAGLLCGAIALVRSSAIALPLVAAAYLAGRSPGAERRRAALVLVATAALLIAPWEIRFHVHAARGVPAPSYFARPLAEGIYPDLVYRGSAPGYAFMTDPEFKNFSTSITRTLATLWERTKTDPWPNLRWNLVGRWLTLWRFEMIQSPPINIYPVREGLFRPAALNPAGVDEPLAVLYHVFRALYYAVVVPGTFLGALLVFRRRRDPPTPASRLRELTYLVLAYNVLLHSVIIPEPRFLVPLRPILFVLALGTVAEVVAWARARWPAGLGAASPAAWLPALAALAIAVAYANGLHIGFQFDDWHVIQENPHIRSLANIPRFFVDPTTASALLQNRDLRPIVQTTLALNYAISGDATWSYHLLNLVLHWAVVLLVFRIVRDHLWLGEAAVPIAAAAALVVAVHPLNTEAVDYVSARSALLTAVFYLGAFDAGVRGRRAACLLLFALALLTKAVAMTFPVALAGWFAVARAAGERRPMPWALLAALLALDVAAGLWRAWLIPSAALDGTHAADVTRWVYCMTEWSAYLYYLRLFVWPGALVVDRLDYPIVRHFSDPRAWASLLALGALGALAWRARRRHPALTFAALWYAVTLAAESTVFPLAEPVNEHRPYLAMLGLATAAAVALWHLGRVVAVRTGRPAAFAMVCALCVSLLAARTYARNEVWGDTFTLWRDATEKAPANPRAWLNAGNAAMRAGRNDEARRFYLESVRLSPCYAWVLINLSVLERNVGDPAASLRWANEAVACTPSLALVHHYQGAAFLALGRPDDALVAFRRATATDEHYAAAWFEQARLLEERGEWAAAAAAFDASFAADPTTAEAAMRAGLLYRFRMADPTRAIARFESVLAVDPRHYGAHYQLATARLASGDTAGARRAWAAFVPLAEAIGDRASLDGAPEALRLAGR
jgi:tetratricopeptide (TPR) repeat protein